MKLREFQDVTSSLEILALLKELGRSWKRQIELKTGARQQTITKALEFLIEKGYIKAHRSATGFSQPRCIYLLTPEGEEIANHIIEIKRLLESKK